MRLYYICSLSLPPHFPCIHVLSFVTAFFFFFFFLTDLLFAVLNWIISNLFVFYSALFSFPEINLGSRGGIVAKSVFRHWDRGEGGYPEACWQERCAWRRAVIGMRSDRRNLFTCYSLTVYYNKMNEVNSGSCAAKVGLPCPFVNEIC